MGADLILVDHSFKFDCILDMHAILVHNFFCGTFLYTDYSRMKYTEAFFFFILFFVFEMVLYFRALGAILCGFSRLSFVKWCLYLLTRYIQ